MSEQNTESPFQGMFKTDKQRAEDLRKWAIEQVIDSNRVTDYSMPPDELIVAAQKITNFVLFDQLPEERRPHFFSQDDSGHWYCVPYALRESWSALTNNDSDDFGNLFNTQFSQYRVNGGISDIIVFLNK